MLARHWRKLAPVYAYTGVIFVLGSVPIAIEAQDLPQVSDKVQHFAAFMVMEILLFRALGLWPRLVTDTQRHLVAVTLSSVLGALLEVWQWFIPWRSTDFRDWLADTIGAVLGALLALLFVTVARRTKS